MTEPTATSYKLLRRTVADRKVAGVCGGLGRYLDIDPVIVRVGLAVLAVVTGGVAALVYPVLWWVIPEEATPGS